MRVAGGGLSAAAGDRLPPDRTRLWLTSACAGRRRPWRPGALQRDGAVEHVAAGLCGGVGRPAGDRSCRLPSSCLFRILNLARTRPSSLESLMMPGWGRLWCLRWGQWDPDSETDRVILAYSPAVDCSHRRLRHRFPSPGQCGGFCPCLVWPGRLSSHCQ